MLYKFFDLAKLDRVGRLGCVLPLKPTLCDEFNRLLLVLLPDRNKVVLDQLDHLHLLGVESYVPVHDFVDDARDLQLVTVDLFVATHVFQQSFLRLQPPQSLSLHEWVLQKDIDRGSLVYVIVDALFNKKPELFRVEFPLRLIEGGILYGLRGVVADAPSHEEVEHNSEGIDVDLVSRFPSVP